MSWWQWLLLGAAFTLVVYAALVVWLLAAGRRQDARAVAGFIPDCIVLFRRRLSDERVPRRAKLLILALIAYLVTPIDLVPDFIPVAGHVDDAVVVVLVMRGVLRAAGPAVVAQHWAGSQSVLEILIRVAAPRSRRGGGEGGRRRPSG
jgi:uncharacterized membrane protein YkvA (DUF1232 family)